MAAIVTSHALEMELAGVGGGWTNVGTGTTNYLVVPEGGYAINIKRGVDPATRAMYVATCDFALDNVSEVFTPGNTASAYYNRLVKGIGVRYSTTVGATTRYWFRGTVADIQPTFADYGSGENHIAISCKGLAQQLADAKTYSTAVQANVDVDDAATAIMVAVGSTLYSFEDSNTVLPYVYPRSDPLSDLVALYASEPGSLLFEDGQGRMVGLKVESMTGGYASPTHTWGSTISPVGDIVPDYRNEAVFARQEVQFALPTISIADAVLYRHPFNRDTGLCELLPSGQNRVIAGKFAVAPVSAAAVNTKLVPLFETFTITQTGPYSNIGASDTALYTSDPNSNPTTFQANMKLRLDDEIMLVTAAVTNQGTHSQSITVTRGVDGTKATSHPWVNGKVFSLIAAATYRALLGHLTVQDNGPPNTTWTVDNPAAFKVNYVCICSNEQVLVTGVGPTTITVQRGYNGTTGHAHAVGSAIYRNVTITDLTPVPGTSYVIASEFPDGNPPITNGSGIIGTAQFAAAADVEVTGDRFRVGIGNQATEDLYMADLVITGQGMTIEGTQASIAYELAVPGLIGLPDGPTISMPYGNSDVNAVKGAAMSALMAGRLQSPWLPLTFLVDSATTADDLIGTTGVEIGHLARYIGLGTNRELIDEWYRVMGIEMNVPDVVSGTQDLEPIQMVFTLAPAHGIRDARKVATSDFSIGPDLTLNIVPSGVSGFSGAPASWYLNNSANPPRAYKANGTSHPVVVNLGSGDQEVRIACAGMTGSQNSYGGTPNGVGALFRSNSAGTSCWQAFFLPFAGGFVFLWNTTDGTVATAAWTRVDGDSLIVRAQGTRIRVYVSDKPEPIIDVTSTRFQTQTYAGFDEKHTVVSASQTPYFTSFYGQGL